jgi:tetrahydromethanopterin S-methyltransferase subunit B
MQTQQRMSGVPRVSLNQFALLVSSVGALVVMGVLSWSMLNAPSTGLAQPQGAACDATCRELITLQMRDFAEQVRELDSQTMPRNTATCDAACRDLTIQQMLDLAEQVRELDRQPTSRNAVVCDAACLERLMVQMFDFAEQVRETVR